MTISQYTSSLSGDNDNLKAILYGHAENGFYLFPVGTDKQPYTKHGFKDATCTQAGIDDFFKRYPRSQWAGWLHRQFIIDIDIKRVNGFESLARLEEKLGHKLPITRTHKSASGGKHFIYKQPPGYDIRKADPINPEFPGVDLQANDCYIVLPPSRCLLANGEYGDYTVLDDSPIIEAPIWLADFAIESQKRQAISGQAKTNVGPIPHGEQQFWILKQIRSYQAKGSSEDATARKIIIDIAERCIDQDPKDPFTEDWVREKVHYCYANPLPDNPNYQGNGHKPVSELETIEYKELETPEDQTELTLTLPDTAWNNPILRDYRNLLSPTTEASDNFHYGAGIHVISFTLNRLVHTYVARRIHPNFYTVFIGITGRSKKDTAMNGAENLIMDLHEKEFDDEDGNYGVIPGIGSAEGMFAYIQGENKVMLLKLSEYSSLPQKAKQHGSGNIIQLLTELWDMRDRYEFRTIQGGRRVSKKPFFSAMTSSTPDWLIENTTQSEIKGGFSNRWLYIYGTAKPPKAIPEKMDKDQRNQLMEDINAVRKWAQELYKVNEGEILPNTESIELFTTWYQDFSKALDETGILPSLLARLPDYACKIALINACCDCSDTITGYHMDAALQVANFMKASIKEVFKTFSTSIYKQDENKIILLLKQKGRLSHRDLYHLMNTSTGELEKLITPMIKWGIIKGKSYKYSNGKSQMFYDLGF